MVSQNAKIELVADWLEKQIQDSSITDGTIWQQLALSKRSFYRLKPKAALLVDSRQSIRQKELENIKLHELKQGLKQGLKSKTERILNLQRQIDDIQSDLDRNQTFEYLVVQGTVQKVSRELMPTEKANLRRSIKYIQSEISKIEGDYAPKKIMDVTEDEVIIPGE